MELSFQVYSIYTDYSKAFDHLDHSLLVAKLGELGIGDMTPKWLESFLVKRRQCVKLTTFSQMNS